MLFKSIPLDEEYLVAGQGDSSEETEVFSACLSVKNKVPVDTLGVRRHLESLSTGKAAKMETASLPLW